MANLVTFNKDRSVELHVSNDVKVLSLIEKGVTIELNLSELSPRTINSIILVLENCVD